LKSSESMKNNTNFKKVYQNGKSYANTYLIMYILKNETEKNQIGISVSKKVGNSVVRHRITRLIRESYRLNENMFNSGLDIVVIARAGARGKNYSEINSALMHLAKMQKILKEMIKS
jgi:ribonuclease P protein component